MMGEWALAVMCRMGSMSSVCPVSHLSQALVSRGWIQKSVRSANVEPSGGEEWRVRMRIVRGDLDEHRICLILARKTLREAVVAGHTRRMSGC